MSSKRMSESFFSSKDPSFMTHNYIPRSELNTSAKTQLSSYANIPWLFLKQQNVSKLNDQKREIKST